MYMGEGGNPSTQTVHIARGQTVARAEMRPNFNPQRVTQRVVSRGKGGKDGSSNGRILRCRVDQVVECIWEDQEVEMLLLLMVDNQWAEMEEDRLHP